MATYDDFLPEIRLRAPHVSEPVVQLYVRRAAIRFCERTLIYTRLTQDFAFAGEGRVDFGGFNTEEEEYESCVAAWYLQTKLDPLAEPQLDTPIPFFANGFSYGDAQQNTPRVFFEITGERNVIGVYPLPAVQVQDAFTFRLAFKPADASTVIPDVLRRDWSDAIVEGALSYILAVKGQPWTDAKGAQDAAIMFQSYITAARIAAQRGRNVTADLVVAPRPFA
jgi:hypothetical protein